MKKQSNSFTLSLLLKAKPSEIRQMNCRNNGVAKGCECLMLRNGHRRVRSLIEFSPNHTQCATLQVPAATHVSRISRNNVHISVIARYMLRGS